MSNVLTSNSTLVCGKLRKFYPNCQQEWLNDLVLRNGDVIFNVSRAKEEPLYYYVNAAVLDYVIDYYKKYLHPRNIGSQFSCGINVTNGQLHMMCFRDGWSGTTAILKLPTLSAEEYPKRYIADSKPSPLGQDYESETIHAVKQQAKELGWNPSNVLWVKIDAGILLDTLTLPNEQQQTPASAPIFTRPDVVDFEPLGNKQIRESLFADDFVEEKESPVYNISTATKEIRDKGFTCYFYIPANKIHHPAVAEKCWLFDAFIKGVRIAWKCKVQDIKEKAMYVPRRGMYYIELNIQFGHARTPNMGSIQFEQVDYIPKKVIVEQSKTEKERMAIICLSAILKKMHEEAPNGTSTAMYHLFGVIFKEEWEKLSGAERCKVLKGAGKGVSFVTEVNKGMKLASFVEPKSDWAAAIERMRIQAMQR